MDGTGITVDIKGNVIPGRPAERDGVNMNEAGRRLNEVTNFGIIACREYRISFMNNESHSLPACLGLFLFVSRFRGFEGRGEFVD
jgi:hypothetical protein